MRADAADGATGRALAEDCVGVAKRRDADSAGGVGTLTDTEAVAGAEATTVPVVPWVLARAADEGAALGAAKPVAGLEEPGAPGAAPGAPGGKLGEPSGEAAPVAPDEGTTCTVRPMDAVGALLAAPALVVWAANARGALPTERFGAAPSVAEVVAGALRFAGANALPSPPYGGALVTP